MNEYRLSPAQIRKLNKMKDLDLDPTNGGTLTLPNDLTQEATIHANGIEVKLTQAEAYKL